MISNDVKATPIIKTTRNKIYVVAVPFKFLQELPSVQNLKFNV